MVAIPGFLLMLSHPGHKIFFGVLLSHCRKCGPLPLGKPALSVGGKRAQLSPWGKGKFLAFLLHKLVCLSVSLLVCICLYVCSSLPPSLPLSFPP